MNKCELEAMEFRSHRDYFDTIPAPDLHDMIMLAESRLIWQVYEETFKELYELALRRF